MESCCRENYRYSGTGSKRYSIWKIVSQMIPPHRKTDQHIQDLEKGIQNSLKTGVPISRTR
jgi:hypothetical protein